MARPPLRGEPANRRLAFRLSASEYLALVRLARANSLTLSALVSEAVVEFASDLGEGKPLVCRARSCESCPFCSTVPTD